MTVAAVPRSTKSPIFLVVMSCVCIIIPTPDPFSNRIFNFGLWWANYFFGVGSVSAKKVRLVDVICLDLIDYLIRNMYQKMHNRIIDSQGLKVIQRCSRCLLLHLLAKV